MLLICGRWPFSRVCADCQLYTDSTIRDAINNGTAKQCTCQRVCPEGQDYCSLSCANGQPIGPRYGQPGGSKTPLTTGPSHPPPIPGFVNATPSLPRSPRAQTHWVDTYSTLGTQDVGRQAEGDAISGGEFTLEGSSSGRIGLGGRAT